MEPIINGNSFSHTSMRVIILGKNYELNGLKEISWDWDLSPGDVFGTGIKKLGRTSGQFKCTGSMTLVKEEADALKAVLGPGYALKPFDISVVGVESDRTFTAELKGIRMGKMSFSSSAGSEGLTEKYDLDILDIIENGISPVSTGNNVPNSSFSSSAAASVSANLSLTAAAALGVSASAAL